MSKESTLESDSIKSLTAHQGSYIASQILSGSVRSLPTGFSISVSAPGKVILHGEHSVVYGKLAIAGSLGLRTKVKLLEMHQNEPDLNNIGIELKALNLDHSYNLSDIHTNLLHHPLPLLKNSSNFSLEKPELLNHDALVRVIENFVNKRSGTFPLSNFQYLSLTSLFYLFYAMFSSVNFDIDPFILTVESDLTLNAGTGSSASFLVCLVATFYQYIRIKTQQKENASRNGFKSLKLRSVDIDKFDKKDLDLISKWAYTAERIIHGGASGVDNTICTYGSLVEFRKSSGPKQVEMPHKIKILLVNTKVPRETKKLVTRVATLRENYPTIADHILNALNEVAENALQYLVNIGKMAKDLTTDAKKKKFQKQFDKLGELVDVNHSLLRALQVSHSTLDRICAILSDNGLHGKLTGAGGGGYAFALVPPFFETSALDELIKKLENEGFDAVVTDLGGPGVTID